MIAQSQLLPLPPPTRAHMSHQARCASSSAAAGGGAIGGTLVRYTTRLHPRRARQERRSTGSARKIAAGAPKRPAQAQTYSSPTSTKMPFRKLVPLPALH